VGHTEYGRGLIGFGVVIEPIQVDGLRLPE
jgi:hypothetical protein